MRAVHWEPVHPILELWVAAWQEHTTRWEIWSKVFKLFHALGPSQLVKEGLVKVRIPHFDVKQIAYLIFIGLVKPFFELCKKAIFLNRCSSTSDFFFNFSWGWEYLHTYIHVIVDLKLYLQRLFVFKFVWKLQKLIVLIILTHDKFTNFFHDFDFFYEQKALKSQKH